MKTGEICPILLAAQEIGERMVAAWLFLLWIGAPSVSIVEGILRFRRFHMNRRDFMAAAAGTMLTMLSGEDISAHAGKGPVKTKVALIKGSDRTAGVQRAVRALGINPVAGKKVLLKPNFNTADPFPASTHNDTLTALIVELQSMGAGRITIGERCGPPDTADVLRDKDIYNLGRILDVDLINFEELPADQWIRVRPEKSHWQDGFLVAKPVLDAECVVSTCCLKTHRYGGVFTMSLKLSVGITHKDDMSELHGEVSGNMRKMIAEINQAYSPALIVMDGMEVFVDGGPMTGNRKRADVIIAGTDRVAIDAVGLAVLKSLGANPQIMNTKIFKQEQIARAVELGLGVAGSDQIEIVADERGKLYAEELMQILQKEG
jgi:uncharacterized protein (DUF362 family)